VWGYVKIFAICLAVVLSRNKLGVKFSWFALWNARVQGGSANISRNGKHLAGEDVNQETLPV